MSASSLPPGTAAVVSPIGSTGSQVLELLLSHPIFWPKKDILDFIVKFSNYMHKHRNQQACVRALWVFNEIVGNSTDWTGRLTDDIHAYCQNPGARGRYNKTQLIQLIRAIRNTSVHFDELDEIVRQEFGAYPNKYADYWLSKFPKLIPFLFAWMNSDASINTRARFTPYFLKNGSFKEEHSDLRLVVKEINAEVSKQLSLGNYLCRYILNDNMMDVKLLFMSPPSRRKEYDHPGLLSLIQFTETPTIVAMDVTNDFDYVSVVSMNSNDQDSATLNINLKYSPSPSQIYENSLIIISDSVNDVLEVANYTSHKYAIVFTGKCVSDIASEMSKQQNFNRDIVRFGELDVDYRKELLDTKVKFQNRECVFGDISSDRNILEDFQEICRLSSHCVKLEFLNWTFPEKPLYYIESNVISRKFTLNSLVQEIVKETFSSERKDKFVVKNLDDNKFSELLKKSIRGRGANSNKVEELFFHANGNRANSVILSGGYSMKYIENSDKFVWSESAANLYHMKALSEMYEVEREDRYLNFVATSNVKVVVLSDNPGMGKSTLFTSIANKLAKSSPPGIIRFIRAITLSEKVELTSTVEDILKVIIPEIKDSFFLHRLVDNIISVHSNCHFFFDGFDELSLDQVQVFFTAVDKLMHYAKNAKIWINTQPFYLELIEKHFEKLNRAIICNRIKPFDLNDQIKFLQKFWTVVSEYSGDQGSLKVFAQKCIDGFKADYMDIMGIPLMCRLLAEAHENIVRKSSQNSGILQNSKTYIISSVIDLYSKAVENFFRKFLERDSITSPRIDSHVIDNARKRMKAVHIRLALRYLALENWYNIFEKMCCWCSNEANREEVLAYGIVTHYDRKAGHNFLHAIFADYFVALFVYEMIFEGIAEENQFSIGEFIVTKLLEESNGVFRHEKVLHFFGKMIPVDRPINPELTSLHHYFTIQDKSFHVFHSKLSLAFTHRSPQVAIVVVKLLLDSLAGQAYLKEYISSRSLEQLGNLVSNACNLSTADFKYFCNVLKCHGIRIKDLEYVTSSPFWRAVFQGNLKKIKFLVDEEAFEKSTWFDSPLFPEYMVSTMAERDEYTTKFSDVFDYLINVDSKILEKKNLNGETLLLQLATHKKIEKSIINYISEKLRCFGLSDQINAKDNSGNTFLHLVSIPTGENKITSNQFHEILQACIHEDYSIHEVNHHGLTILNTAVRSFTPTSETLMLLQQNEFNFSLAASDKCNIFIDAIKYKHFSLHFLQQIIRNGCTNFHGYRHVTSILHALTEIGDIKALKYFIEVKKLNVNLDVDGITVLNQALRSYNKLDPEVGLSQVKYLFSKGAKLQTSLHVLEDDKLLNVLLNYISSSEGKCNKQ